MINVVFLLAFGSVCFVLGYVYREHQYSSRVQTYTQVTVLKKISENSYLVWPERMKEQHINICPESFVGWYEGEVLDDWTFEQRQGCKHVISYHERLKGEIDASIQIRR